MLWLACDLEGSRIELLSLAIVIGVFNPEAHFLLCISKELAAYFGVKRITGQRAIHNNLGYLQL